MQCHTSIIQFYIEVSDVNLHYLLTFVMYGVIELSFVIAVSCNARIVEVLTVDTDLVLDT